jgi:hypothetical protein
LYRKNLWSMCCSSYCWKIFIYNSVDT